MVSSIVVLRLSLCIEDGIMEMAIRNALWFGKQFKNMVGII